jgi:SRSO17 transposase
MPLACVPILHRWEDDGCHFLLIRRSLTDPQEKAYYFVFAPQGTLLQEMVEAIGARWHIEEDAGKRQRSGSGPLRGGAT